MRLYLLPALVAALCLVGASAKPQPQGGVNGDDVLASASSAARYGNSQGEVDEDLLGELFGSPAKDPPRDHGYRPPVRHEDTTYDDCEHPVYVEQGFSCVHYYNCDEYGEIIVDGTSLIDIRGNFDQEHEVTLLEPEFSKCPGDLEVCCRDPEFTELATAPPRPPPPPPPPKYVSRCGRRNLYGVGVRIQNSRRDAETQFGEWPAMCAILRDEPTRKNLFVGGATLIAEDLLITAPHKIYKYRPSELKIRCGEWDTQGKVEARDHQERYVADYVLHPGFHNETLAHDFAIVRVESRFDLDDHLDVMCLPDPDEEYPFDYDDCVATGWGKDQFGDPGQYQYIMKQVKLDLVERLECQTALRDKTKLGRHFKLHDSFVCAGGKQGVDTCRGDGGGPLMCPRERGNEEDYVLAGLVAWGIGCGEEGVPGVYADVTTAHCFIDWATSCLVDDKPHYPPGCNGWIEEAEAAFRKKLSRVNAKIDRFGLTEDLEEKRDLAEFYLDEFVHRVETCDPGYYDEHESSNVSDYGRTGTNNNNPGVRSNAEEVENFDADADSEEDAEKVFEVARAEKEEAAEVLTEE